MRPKDKPDIRSATVYKCSCNGEGLEVTATQWNDDPIEVEISFWAYGFDTPYSWGEKWRAIKYILKHGHPYTDMVTMTVDTAREFANAVLHTVEHPERLETLHYKRAKETKGE